MDKLGNVMKGLGCCSQGAKEPYTPTIRYCAGCPYLKSKIPCTRALARDALELLKEQEPRVMTLEEVAQNAYSYYHTPDSVKPVFVQFRDETYSDEALTPPWRGGVNQRALLKEPNRYGMDFVFWTDRPSDEQMKGVEWVG